MSGSCLDSLTTGTTVSMIACCAGTLRPQTVR